jgi:hypothetical protein
MTKYPLKMFLGKLTFFIDGRPIGTSVFIAQIAFATNLDLVTIGSFESALNDKSTASLEFYLKPLSQAEIIIAMNKSYSLAYNSDCNAGQ